MIVVSSIFANAAVLTEIWTSARLPHATCASEQAHLVNRPAMDTLEFLPFEDAQVQQIEEFHASKFGLKEIRIKDLYKHLCKRPSMSVRLVKQANNNSGAERDESCAERSRRSCHPNKKIIHDGPPKDQDDGEAAVEKVLMPQSGNVQREVAPTDLRIAELPVFNPRPRKLTVQEIRLPLSKVGGVEHRKSNENERGDGKRGGATNRCLSAKSRNVERQHSPAPFFDVPIHQVDHPNLRATVTTGERSSLSSTSRLTDAKHLWGDRARVAEASSNGRGGRLVKHSYLSSLFKFTDERRGPRASVQYSEARCAEDEPDIEPCELMNRTHKRGLKWSYNFPEVFTEGLPVDKKNRTLASKTKWGPIFQGSRKVRSAGIKSRTPQGKLKSSYYEDSINEVEMDVDTRDTNYPSFAREMKHSNVTTCFWLGVPASFGKEYLPSDDHILVLEDEKGLNWETNYLVRKSGLSAGWRRFSLDHGLQEGDILVFELVKPFKFKVYITRVSEGGKAIILAREPVRQIQRKPAKAPTYSTERDKRIPAMLQDMSTARKRDNTETGEIKFPRKKPNLPGRRGIQESRKGPRIGCFCEQGTRKDPQMGFVLEQKDRKNPKVHEQEDHQRLGRRKGNKDDPPRSTPAKPVNFLEVRSLSQTSEDDDDLKIISVVKSKCNEAAENHRQRFNIKGTRFETSEKIQDACSSDPCTPPMTELEATSDHYSPDPHFQNTIVTGTFVHRFGKSKRHTELQDTHRSCHSRQNGDLHVDPKTVGFYWAICPAPKQKMIEEFC